MDNTGYCNYFRTNIHLHLPIVLDCHDALIYVGRKVAYILNNGLGRRLNANPNGQDVVAILHIDYLSE